jgi:hypothetical protein
MENLKTIDAPASATHQLLLALVVVVVTVASALLGGSLAPP